jgi:hypothetical protein
VPDCALTLSQLSDRESVLRAVAMFDDMGRDALLAQFGFGPSRRYLLVYQGRQYDSKAIVGVAHGLEFPDLGPLRRGGFSGGLTGAAGKLHRLGFQVDDLDAEGDPPPVPSSVVQGLTDVVALVGCVKGKLDHPAPARDLYTSDLFRKRKAYVERNGLPWLILSAQHGVVSPDDRLEPYDLALGGQSAAYRRHWGEMVVGQLHSRLGPLSGVRFEAHAGAPYSDAIRQPLRLAGATLSTPLQGLTQGRQLAWYLRPPPRDVSTAETDPAQAARVLGDPKLARPCGEFPWGRGDLDQPGLYSWWTDAAGAAELSHSLGLPVPTGLVYAGQAGATSTQIGKSSAATLRSRIRQHLSGSASASTWRLSLTAMLTSDGPGPSREAEDRLSAWMREHLRLSVLPVTDRTGLVELEHATLLKLDPPLNLDGMPRTGLRIALTALRSISRASAPPRGAPR